GGRSGGGGTVVSSVGIGTPRQQTPMLITEGNALSLLNRLSWDTLRRFTKLPFAAASRGGHGGSSCQALAEWRSGEGWYGTLVKAHSHLCADLNDDVRALPRCPLAVGLLKSKLSWLHSCLGRTTAAADKSQVMLALLEPFPGAGRWSLWRHPLHLAACHLAIAGRPGAYEKLRRTFNAFLRPGMFELPPFESFHKLTQLCHSCSPTVTLLVKAYMPHLEPLLSPPPAPPSSPANNANANANANSATGGGGGGGISSQDMDSDSSSNNNNNHRNSGGGGGGGGERSAAPGGRHLPGGGAGGDSSSSSGSGSDREMASRSHTPPGGSTGRSSSSNSSSGWIAAGREHEAGSSQTAMAAAAAAAAERAGAAEARASRHGRPSSPAAGFHPSASALSLSNLVAGGGAGAEGYAACGAPGGPGDGGERVAMVSKEGGGGFAGVGDG
ncbi:unnamed protein product, partial [Scytosiphon promiscuus]